MMLPEVPVSDVNIKSLKKMKVVCSSAPWTNSIMEFQLGLAH